GADGVGANDLKMLRRAPRDVQVLVNGQISAPVGRELPRTRKVSRFRAAPLAERICSREIEYEGSLHGKRRKRKRDRRCGSLRVVGVQHRGDHYLPARRRYLRG